MQRTPEQHIQILEEQLEHIKAKIAKIRANMVAPAPPPHRELTHHVIECDAGTSCNNPAKGYGVGYGSFLIDNTILVKRMSFGKGHSVNSAEIRIATAALKALAETGDPSKMSVLVRSDSKIALKWVTHTGKPSEKTSAGFREAIDLIRIETAKFAKVKAEWRGRAHSVKLFGH